MKPFNFALVILLTLLTQTVQAVSCYNNTPPSNPDNVYTVHGNGTVTDNRTGLMWKVCAEGISWSSGTCTGFPQFFSWTNALTQAESATYAGHSDWRLPNVKELGSLIEECRGGFNDSVFPIPQGDRFWSGSPFAGDQDFAWVVDSLYGGAGNGRNYANHVRLVRGGQGTSTGTYLLAVILAGTGSGRVTSIPSGIDTQGDPTEHYAASTKVTLTAVPAAGSTFSGWIGGGCYGLDLNCTVTVNKSTTVKAVFAKASIKPKVVFIPGFLGTRLYRDADRDGRHDPGEDPVWETTDDDDVAYFTPLSGGSFDSSKPVVIGSHQEPDLGILDTAFGMNFYKPLIETLDLYPGRENWTTAPWDWRGKVSDAVARVKEAIARIAVNGEDVVLIGHSTGGLIARAYLKEQQDRAKNGTASEAARVSRFISVAVPHYGSPQAEVELLHGDRNSMANGLVDKPHWRTAGTRMFAAHELLPSPAALGLAQETFIKHGKYSATIEKSITEGTAICSPGWYYSSLSKSTSTNEPKLSSHSDYFAWLANHPDMANADPAKDAWPWQLNTMFLDWAKYSHNTRFNWKPDRDVDLIYGTGIKTLSSIEYSRPSMYGQFPECGFNLAGLPKWCWRCIENDAPQREPFLSKVGDGTVPAWSAMQIPYTNGWVRSKRVSLVDAGWLLSDLDHATIFAHAEVKNHIACQLGAPSCVTVMAAFAQADAAVELTSVIKVLGANLVLHAYDGSNRHTGPLDDGRMEEAIPHSKAFSDGSTHKLWLPGSLTNYQIVIRARVDGVVPLVESENWEDDVRVRQTEFDPLTLNAVDVLRVIRQVDGTDRLDVDRGGDGIADDVLPAVPTQTMHVSITGMGWVSSSPGGIECTAECDGLFLANDVVTLTASTLAGSTFAGWSGACAGTSTTCQVTMDSAKSVTAAFGVATLTHPLTVTLAGSGVGAVTSTGIDCGTDCTETYPEGTQITLTAIPDGLSIFAGWSGECSGTGTCVLEMTRSMAVTAYFEPPQTTALTLSNLDHTYNGWEKSATCQANPSTAGTVISYNALPYLPVHAGSYLVSCVTAEPGYQGSTQGTLVIAKAAQSISHTAPQHIYINVGSLLNVKASSGLVVTLTSETPAICTVNGSVATGLSVGTCRIRAEQGGTANFNAALPVVMEASVLAQSVPSAPTLLRLIPLDGSLKVFFSQPVVTGGSAISSYTVSCLANGSTFTAQGTSSPITVTGLTNGVRYTCTVSATNGTGTSPASREMTKLLQQGSIAPILNILMD